MIKNVMLSAAEASLPHDMTKDKHLMAIYADNEQHNGYHRDGCVWKEEINIFDKLAAQTKRHN